MREPITYRLNDRVKRVFKIDPGVFEEVEADPDSIRQAVLLVVLSSLAAGIGSLSALGAAGLVANTIGALIGWVIWAFLIYIIGTRLLPEPQTRSDYKEVLRTVGFATAPGLIRVLGIIPGLFTLTFVVAGIWILVATVVAVRQALDYRSTWRAVGVCVLGWLVQAIIMLLLSALIGVAA